MEKQIMIIWIIFAVLAIGIFILWINKIHIDWRSIISRTIPLDTGVFGIYCFTGKQGSGKTYSLVKHIKKHSKGRKIYSNMTIAGIDYERIRSVDHLLSLRDEKDLYIVYDEIFTLLTDESRLPAKIKGDLREFMSQQRKMKNILLTTAQEWLDIPIMFRRYTRIRIACSTRPLGRWGGVLIERYEDAYQMEWSNEANEYIAPLISHKFSKYEKRFMESYNTYERIRSLKSISV